jgi:hypothetical protein
VRAALRVAGALALLAASAVLARAAGGVLPDAVAVAGGFALALGLPGAAALRVLRLDARLGVIGSLAAVPIAGLTAWILPLFAGLAIGVPFEWVMWAVLLSAALTLALLPAQLEWEWRNLGLAGAAAAVAALLASRWQPPFLADDALFHAGRVRKLLDLPELSFSGLSAYQDGHVHAGYAVPLLHAVDAAAISLAGLEPSSGYLALTAASAALVPIAVFAAGRALGGAAVGVCATLLTAWGAASLGDGDGVIGGIQQPGSLPFWLLIPIAVYLIAELYRTPDDRRLAVAVVATVFVIALVHPTYAFVPLAMLAATVIARRRGMAALTWSAGLTTALLAAIWWTAIRGGSPSEGRALSSHDYWIVAGHPATLAGDWVVHDRVEALAAIALIAPLLFLFDRRYAFAAALVGGALALVSVPGVTTVVAEAIGNGQARRLWAGIPLSFLPAIGIVLLAVRLSLPRVVAAAGAIAAASLAVVSWDGFWSGWLTVPMVAVGVGATAILLVRRVQPMEPELRPADPAAPLLPVLFLTVALIAGGLFTHGRSVASTVRHGADAPPMRHRLTPGVIAFMRAHDAPPFPVVMAPVLPDKFIGIVFQLIGQADVHAVALPEIRTRAEPRNDPLGRMHDVETFFDPGTSVGKRAAILREYDVRYVVLDVKRTPQHAAVVDQQPGLTLVYADVRSPRGFGRFRVWAVETP